MEPHVSTNDNYQVKSRKSLHNVKFRNLGNSEHQTHNRDRAQSDHRLFSEQKQNLGDQKFKEDGEVETTVAQWPITQNTE